MEIKVNVATKMRKYYSIQHVQSAAHFSRLSAKIEDAYDGKFSEELITEHQAYVTASIFATVSFLEATINEFFADAYENTSPHNRTSQLIPHTQALIASIWKLGVPRTANFRILQKFQIALTLAQQPTFDPGTPLYQNVDSLIHLRNALTHFEPRWMEVASDTLSEEAKTHELEKRLRGKFSLNPLAGDGNAFFPDRCLSCGCAKWALNSSTKFADEFFSRIAFLPTFDHIRSRLKME